MSIEMIDYILFAVIALLVLGMALARNHDKKIWNKGFCPDCLTIWQRFGMDSQGGRGYHCECKPRRHIWISYNVD